MSGMLNTRKLELVHVLLKDIHMFHAHPHILPAETHSNQRLTERCLAKALLHLSSNNISTQRASSIPATLLFPKSDDNDDDDEIPNTTSSAAATLNVEASLGDVHSFLTYARAESARASSSTYQPIHAPDQHTCHGVSYTPLLASCHDHCRGEAHSAENSGDDDEASDDERHESAEQAENDDDDDDDDEATTTLDLHSLQAMHNGFTFVCVLGGAAELEAAATSAANSSSSSAAAAAAASGNCGATLLHVRLANDNATLVWSQPAWTLAVRAATTTTAKTESLTAASQQSPTTAAAAAATAQSVLPAPSSGAVSSSSSSAKSRVLESLNRLTTSSKK